MESHSSVTECPTCGPGFIQEDSTGGDLICTQCGRVLDASMVDHGADWNLVDNGVTLGGTNSDKARATQITALDGEGGTFVGYGGKAGALRKCMHHANSSDEKSRDSKAAKNLHAKIKNVITRLALPDEDSLVERIFEILHGVQVKSQTAMRNPFIIGGLFFALRMTNVPRGIAELSDLTKDALGIKMNTKLLKQNVMKLHKLISKSPDASAVNASLDNIKAVTTEDYLPRYCTRLGLPMNIERNARRILGNVEASLAVKKQPPMIAAAAICVAAKNEDANFDIADVAKTLSMHLVALRILVADLKKKCDRLTKLASHAKGDDEGIKMRERSRQYKKPMEIV